MSTQLPIRDDSRQREERSVQFFRSCLPYAWTCEKPQNDFGIDLRVGIVEGNQVTGRELLVQLKSSAQEAQGDTVRVRLAVSTYNHLWDHLPVAMLIKYVEAEKEAYWELLKDIPKPPQEQKTFTVHIPRINRLSNIDWSVIQSHVYNVHQKKRSTMF